MLARQDGRRPHVRNDRYRVREACLAAEQRYGLQRTAPGDRTAASRPARAESEKASRRGLKEAPRLTLRRQASMAAAAPANEQEFFAWLRRSGVLGRGPVDLADHRRLRPAAPGPAAGRRPAPSLGKACPARPAHPGARPPRIPERPRDDHPPSGCTETWQTRPRAPARIEEPPPGSQLRRGEDHQTGIQPQGQARTNRLNGKLRARGPHVRGQLAATCLAPPSPRRGGCPQLC
jgi:hypothetical protein